MLQITKSGVVFSGSDADIERMRTDFARQDWVRLPAILDQELLKMIRAAITINLKTEHYQGGVLSIRETKTKRMLCQLTNPGFGDAILFRIDERLEHSVSDVEGTVAKIALPDGSSLSLSTAHYSLKESPVRYRNRRDGSLLGYRRA